MVTGSRRIEDELAGGTGLRADLLDDLVPNRREPQSFSLRIDAAIPPLTTADRRLVFGPIWTLRQYVGFLGAMLEAPRVGGEWHLHRRGQKRAAPGAGESAAGSSR
jgi:hypothetical protein